MRQKVIETEIGRPTEKQKNRNGKIKTEKQTQRNIYRDTELEIQKQRHRLTEGQHIDGKTERQID